MPEASSPLMRQYFEIKGKHKDEIVFYRLGDFYEMFFDDAIIASKVLDLTLTGKNAGGGERAPMCGVPFHSYEAYVARLIARGYKVAICEQTEDPAKAKGLVRREVVRIITPGTITDESMLDKKANNFIASVYLSGQEAGLCFCDISTGEVQLCALSGPQILTDIENECERFSPREAVISEQAYANEALKDFLRQRLFCALEDGTKRFLPEDARQTVHNRYPDAADVENNAVLCCALGGLLSYLYQTQKNALAQLRSPAIYMPSMYMTLDHTARTNLELFETIRSHEKSGSLLWVLDQTHTSMGARALRRRMEQPLLNPVTIRRRLNAVASLVDEPVKLSQLEDALRGISDLERLIGRVSSGSANARDLRAVALTAEKLPQVRTLIQDIPCDALREIWNGIDELGDVRELIAKGIAEDPPLGIKDGAIIREGYQAQLDEVRSIAHDTRSYILSVQTRERERTGIKNLKIGYNKVFGYYIEVTPSFLHLVPEDYIRRQTLTTGERYVTEELKQLESRILGAQERANAIEYELFCRIRDQVAKAADRVQATASAVAELDVTASMARIALDNEYCMPQVDYSDAIDIRAGRHPVVERNMSGFVANDMKMNGRDRRVAVITGPNMAGKSTYMRQNAIIVLMAQLGSFVPARQAHIGVVDRIFTRIGASDDLSAGQSTFMVEMSEVADIVREATNKSLVILDEVGRGTSTYDGMSIARAVLEYMAKRVGAKTLFATHYHELTALDSMPGVFNMSTAVIKHGDRITFLHQIIAGGSDDSYGIEVAKLAGLPDELIRRAHQILKGLEAGTAEHTVKKTPRQEAQTSLADLGTTAIIDRIRETDVDNMTPMQALTLVLELKTRIARLP